MGYFYLASPYSSNRPEVVDLRYRETMRAFAFLINKGVTVFSPIIHCHETANKHSLPTDAAFWWNWNRVFVDASQGVMLLMLDGWENSLGCRQELAYAAEQELPLSCIRFDQADNLVISAMERNPYDA